MIKKGYSPFQSERGEEINDKSYSDDDTDQHSRGSNRFSRFFRRGRSESPAASSNASYRPPIRINHASTDTSTSARAASSSPQRNGNSSLSPGLNISPSSVGKNNKLRRYRGFSTSISSLFLDETLVCPSVSCCGILGSSRTEHLLHVRNQRRKKNTSEFRGPSKILGICLVSLIFGMVVSYVIWGFGSNPNQEYYTGYYRNRNRMVTEQESLHSNSKLAKVPNIMGFNSYRERFWLPFETIVEDIFNQDSYPFSHSSNENLHERSLKENIWNDAEVGSDLRSFLCIVFFLVLGIFGRRRRMKTRFAVLKARAEDDKVYYGFLGRRKNARMGRESKYDGACSHTLCGCYPVDKLQGDDIENPDCMNWSFLKCSKLCCGACCRLWVQCFSVCALAQEAREVRLLLPPQDQRVDYITNEPFEDYFKDIHLLRRRWKSYGVLKRGEERSWRSHLGALSRLSRYILTTFISVTAVLIVTENFNPHAFFSWGDACVLIMTFAQSFIVLGVVHGLFHKSDLSLDAVIKFFGAGFLIATPMAFLVEIFVVNVLMAIYYTIALAVSILAGDGIGLWVFNQYKYFLAIADVLQAYLVAAASEEICKYYTFRSVEHPDLIFLTGLDRVWQDVKTRIGGGEAYPYSSNNASTMENRTGTFESTFSSKSRNSRKNYRGVSPSPVVKAQSILGMRESQNGDDTDIELDIRTVRQRAAAVTTAMISTAVGLACAENFMYVFFLGGNNTGDEIAMLIFRSIFPVHALCAGIQSIGVIKKFLEEGDGASNIGVGKIVLPAIILHGSFDSVLMLINSYVDIISDLDDDSYASDQALLNVIAASCVTGVMIFGTIWYWRQNRLQKARLKELELQLLTQVAQLPVATAPAKRRSSFGFRSKQANELELL